MRLNKTVSASRASSNLPRLANAAATIRHAHVALGFSAIPWRTQDADFCEALGMKVGDANSNGSIEVVWIERANADRALEMLDGKSGWLRKFLIQPL